MTTLDARGVTKVYRQGSVEILAVDQVTLAADAGEILGIMGPSGSGKTTLLSMLGGILRPTAGTVAICGDQVWNRHERQLPLLRRSHVGFIFQTFNLFSALTAVENVEVALNLKGLRNPEATRQALRLLDEVGLHDRAQFLPRDLSGGEKQRVSIARALAGGPRLILADEPTANLDWKNGEQVMRLLQGAAKAERTVLVVTHDHRVVPYTDRILQFEDGRIVE